MSAEPVGPSGQIRSPIDTTTRIDRGAAARDRGVQIAAAQLRLVTDRRLGKVTPDWIKKLAAEGPPRST